MIPARAGRWAPDPSLAAVDVWLVAGGLPEVDCALCGKPIDLRGDYFRASGVFLPAGDPLTRFCGAPMHWSCYTKWPERPRFARHYVDAWQAANQVNPFWWTVYRDDRVYVSVNPERPVEEVSVRLCAVGSDIRVPLPKWADWLAHVDRAAPGVRAVEHQGLVQVLPLLRQRFPDDRAVVNAIDPDEKRPGRHSARRASSR